jgi:hypothetical protein
MIINPNGESIKINNKVFTMNDKKISLQANIKIKLSKDVLKLAKRKEKLSK